MSHLINLLSGKHDRDLGEVLEQLLEAGYSSSELVLIGAVAIWPGDGVFNIDRHCGSKRPLSNGL